MAEDGDDKQKEETTGKQNADYKYWLVLSIQYAFLLALMPFILSATNYGYCKPSPAAIKA
jgi:hypothetical protein